jgi:DNA repair protein SbcC/Rad50
MIKSLELFNFQSHRHTLLEFVPGVNIIIGATDAGKSAIMRAFRWVKDNRPSGANFCSWEGVNDGGPTKVVLTTTDPVTVTRSKGKLELYKVDDLEFKAFKTEVPDEVQQALNMNEMNVKTQFESHFLLNSSPGEVAHHFNKVARLDEIDLATSNINSWIKVIKQTIVNKNALITENQVKLKTFDYIADFETEVIALETADQLRIKLTQENDNLTTLLNNIDTVTNKIAQEAQALQAETLVNTMLADYEKRRTVEADNDKLCSLLNEIDDVQRQLDVDSQLVASENTINTMLDLYKRRVAIEGDSTRLRRLLQNINNTDILLNREQALYDRLHAEFEVAFPDNCPLCNTPHKHSA